MHADCNIILIKKSYINNDPIIWAGQLRLWAAQQHTLISLPNVAPYCLFPYFFESKNFLFMFSVRVELLLYSSPKFSFALTRNVLSAQFVQKYHFRQFILLYYIRVVLRGKIDEKYNARCVHIEYIFIHNVLWVCIESNRLYSFSIFVFQKQKTNCNGFFFITGVYIINLITCVISFDNINVL